MKRREEGWRREVSRRRGQEEVKNREKREIRGVERRGKNRCVFRQPRMRNGARKKN